MRNKFIIDKVYAEGKKFIMNIEWTDKKISKSDFG